MKKFYDINEASKRSCIEIRPAVKFDDDFRDFFFDASIPSSTKRLPDDLVFYIKACKKEYDIIFVHGCGSTNYYSKDFIDVLQRYTDMSDRSYKINLPEATKEYYAIYNLKQYPLINRKELNKVRMSPEEGFTPARFILEKPDLDPVFSVSTTALIVVSEDIMNALTKAKITNVRFDEAYGYTPEEALEWARENPDLADDFTDASWFKELLQK